MFLYQSFIIIIAFDPVCTECFISNASLTVTLEPLEPLYILLDAYL
jgi:predicted DsbA family dithiol-disulfide isomerase